MGRLHNLKLSREMGGPSVPAAVASGVALGTIGWRGYQSAAMSGERAYFEAVTAEAWSASAQGAHLDFGTTAAGATSNATRKMRLTSASTWLNVCRLPTVGVDDPRGALFSPMPPTFFMAPTMPL